MKKCGKSFSLLLEDNRRSSELNVEEKKQRRE